MIDPLIEGKLHGQSQERTSKAGRPFTTAKVLAAIGGGEQAVFVNVLAFDEAVQTALLALGDGCAAALAGSLTPKAWTDKDSNARLSLDLIASSVLAAYHVKRRREAVNAGAAP